MFCTNCGKAILDNSVFCNGGGARIVEQRPIKIEKSKKGKIKIIIYVALCIILILMGLYTLLELFSSKLQSAFYSFVWVVISAYFIERIRKNKIKKLGWIIAGTIVAFYIISFFFGFILGFIYY